MRKILRKFSKVRTKLKQPTEPIHSKDFKFNSIGGFLNSEDSTPKKIFTYLDRHVIGQTEAKRAIAIAYSNPLTSKFRKQMEKKPTPKRRPRGDLP